MYSCKIWIITLYSVLPLGVVGYGNVFNNKPLRFFESLFLFVFHMILSLNMLAIHIVF